MRLLRMRAGIALLAIFQAAVLIGCADQPNFSEAPAIFKNPKAKLEERVNDLLGRMTLDEKIGQMAQVEKGSLRLSQIPEDKIGSVLSGGGGNPSPNNPSAWADMTDAFQKEALKSRLGIPLVYGADAVHGHNNVIGTVIFPHNIGLGAAHDEDLVRRIGRATALEMCATGAFWNFAPVIAVVQDIRWGRTYEAYGENTDLVSRMGVAFLSGLQNTENGGFGSPGTVLATPKHYIGDGGTTWGTGQNSGGGSQFRLDQGVMQFDEAFIRRVFLPPYAAAIKAGARSIMVSFSSWKNTKMHAQKYLLTEVLKGELGFSGFLISDWKAIDQLPGDYYSDIVTSINAGLDMIMIPYDSYSFCRALKQAVEAKDVPIERINDAVRRILLVKFELGLFEHPLADRTLLSRAGSPEHRALAREAVRKSLVLLKNKAALPLSSILPLLLVAGEAADNLGYQCGGWTIEWQGGSGAITSGTTILAGIRKVVGGKTKIEYSVGGVFQTAGKAAIGIAVVGEKPYAEGVGDRDDLSLSADDKDLVRKMRQKCDKLVLVVVSGRPLIITESLSVCDAVVAAWLPGTEGDGVADVLFGAFPFQGKLSFSWPASMDQLPFSKTGGRNYLFPFGYGLTK
jgi:beta-glucosidase